MTQIETASRLMAPTEVSQATTLSKSLIRIMAAEGLFPKPLSIGVKRLAFVRAEVNDWIDQRIAARSAA